MVDLGSNLHNSAPGGFAEGLWLGGEGVVRNLGFLNFHYSVYIQRTSEITHEEKNININKKY